MMEHQESIYNMIPPKYIEQERPPMFKSKTGNVPPTASTFHNKCTSMPYCSNLAGDAPMKPVKDFSSRTLGKAPGMNRNDPNNRMISNSAAGRVMSLKEVKGSCPELLKPSVLRPQLKAGAFRRSDSAPVLNLVTSKNFVVANAVETILAAPKKPAQGTKDYLSKEDYGKVPKYLRQIKGDIEAEYDYIRQLESQRQEAMSSQIAPLEENERQAIIAGLKAKWEQVNTEYQGATHMTQLDTQGKKFRKEKWEAELSQIEKDIEKINRKNLIVDATM